eukprot:9800101-Alexandrium_andersonii.AAC.1
MSLFSRALIGFWRASLAILAAAHAAGLVVDLHHCRGAVLEGPPMRSFSRSVGCSSTRAERPQVGASPAPLALSWLASLRPPGIAVGWPRSSTNARAKPRQ